MLSTPINDLWPGDLVEWNSHDDVWLRAEVQTVVDEWSRIKLDKEWRGHRLVTVMRSALRFI